LPVISLAPTAVGEFYYTNLKIHPTIMGELCVVILDFIIFGALVQNEMTTQTSVYGKQTHALGGELLMKLTTVKGLLDARILTGENEEKLDTITIHSACGSDLMSDVLAFVKEEVLLLTGLVNIQVVRTAEMMDIKAICFVRGKTPEDEVIKFANERGMPIMQTDLPMFLACGKLYNGGLMCGEG